MKQCSLTSQSFLAPSQKLLFSKIYLRSGYDTQPPFRQLHQLLIRSPHILSYIRDLHIIIQLIGAFNDETLPLLLQTLRPFLQSFSLVGRVRSLVWECFSHKLQSSLLDLWISPNLTSVRLINICTAKFPIETGKNEAAEAEEARHGDLRSLLLESTSPSSTIITGLPD